MVTRFNQDICQEIALWLDLSDAISLFQASSQLYFSFSLWHCVLSAAKRVGNIACNPLQGLSVTEFSLLRIIGIRTAALARNWSKAEPDCKSFHHIAMRGHLALALLPGEGILITATIQSGSLAIDCWDVRKNHVTASIPIDDVLMYPYHFSEYAASGTYTIGLMVGPPNSPRIYVICLDYSDQSTISFEKKLQLPIKSPVDYVNIAAYVTKDNAIIVGSRMGPVSPILLATIVNFEDHPPVVLLEQEIPVPIPEAPTCIIQNCFPHEDVLYLILKTPVPIVCVVSPTHQVSVFPLETNLTEDVYGTAVQCHPRFPEGIVYSVEQWLRPTEMILASRVDHFFFRPLELVHGYPNFSHPILIPSTAYFECDYPYTPEPQQVTLDYYNHIAYIDYKQRGQVVPSASGKHALLHNVACPDHGSECFPLLIFHSSTPLHPSVHHLKIPSEVQVVVSSKILQERFRKVFLDDCLGILIVDLEDGIYVLSYV